MSKHLGRCPRCRRVLEFDPAADQPVVCPQCHTPLASPGKPAAPRKPDPLIGQRLGHFEIVELIGRGGMGAVYRAQQTTLDRPCALKVLPRAFARDPSFVARFQREARAAAAVTHPNIIQVYDVGQENGLQFIAMELVEGESLADVLRRDGPLPPDRAVVCMKQVASALAAAHGKNVIHRDIKPSNILVTPKGALKVADFGLAKQIGVDTGVTRTGTVLGTALYIPPEMAEGKKADARSDLYSLGATFYHLLAGQPPFDAPSLAELLLMHTQAELTPLNEVAPGTPPALCEIIHRLLNKDPNERYQSAEDLFGALTRIGSKIPPAAPAPPAPPPRPPARHKVQRKPPLPPIAQAPPQEVLPEAQFLPEPEAFPEGETVPEPGLPDIAPPQVQLPEIAPSPAAVPPKPSKLPHHLGHADLAGHHQGEHVHKPLDKRQAERRKDKEKAVVYGVAGAVGGVLLIVGLLALTPRWRGRKALPPEPEPTKEATADVQVDPRQLVMEANAATLLRGVRRQVESELWLSAENDLRCLRREYKETKYYKDNAAAIEDLWRRTKAALSKPTTAPGPAPTEPSDSPFLPAPPAP